MNKHNCNSYYCYECRYREEKTMEKYNCSLEGINCENNSTIDKITDCEYCGTKDLCSHCYIFGKCCEKKDKSQSSIIA